MPIPQRTEKLLGRHIHDVKVKYIEDALEILQTDKGINDQEEEGEGEEEENEEGQGGSYGIDGPLTASERQSCSDFDASVEQSSVSPMMHRLVSRLLFRKLRSRSTTAINAAVPAAGYRCWCWCWCCRCWCCRFC